jgi:NAD(P)H-hydrate epimerase
MQNYKKNRKKRLRLPIISYFCIVMKIFTRTQIKELDKYTIEHEPIKSIDLMERAARAITNAITDRWAANVPVVVFAGPGNNGGDALAVARMLTDQNYQVQTFLFNISDHLSEDCAANKERLRSTRGNHLLTEVTQEFDPPRLEEGMLVIDGLFGSGLNKPLAGGFASLVKYINTSNAEVVSIDVPSGLMTEDNTYNVRANIIKATLTLTLQQKKLAFLFAENQQFIGELKTLDIRLSKEGIEKTEAQYTITEEKDLYPILKPRDPFAHKGTMGHALLVAGSYGMAGAAVLAAKACMRAGAGKVTVHTPKRNIQILQTAVPEAILHTDREETFFSEAMATEEFQAMGIGPGLGTTEQTSIAMIAQIRRTQCPVVADADALNILGTRQAWMQQLPKGIILTPHPKELDRMEGQSLGSYERLAKARQLAEKLQGYVILKGHYTAICMPDGHVAFNTTGNAGMATAGSGDVLTGILTGLLARGYHQREACLLGVYLHGLAGDLAARELGEESLMASDIIRFLPKAFLRLKK